jgi:hypothetical protein
MKSEYCKAEIKTSGDQDVDIGISGKQEAEYLDIRESGFNTEVFISVHSWFRCYDPI